MSVSLQTGAPVRLTTGSEGDYFQKSEEIFLISVKQSHGHGSAVPIINNIIKPFIKWTRAGSAVLHHRDRNIWLCSAGCDSLGLSCETGTAGTEQNSLLNHPIQIALVFGTDSGT